MKAPGNPTDNERAYALKIMALIVRSAQPCSCSGDDLALDEHGICTACPIDSDALTDAFSDMMASLVTTP